MLFEEEKKSLEYIVNLLFIQCFGSTVSVHDRANKPVEFWQKNKVIKIKDVTQSNIYVSPQM